MRTFWECLLHREVGLGGSDLLHRDAGLDMRSPSAVLAAVGVPRTGQACIIHSRSLRVAAAHCLC